MKSKRAVLLLAGTAVCALIALAAVLMLFSGGLQWPEFPESDGTTPVAVVELERDFGWRTGDIVPVTIYIKEGPSTVCDTKTLVVQGDARLRDYEARAEIAPDGSRAVVIRMELQAFVWKQPWLVKPSIAFRPAPDAELTTMELPEVEILTSPTFEGWRDDRPRDRHPKEPPRLMPLASYDWLGTLAVATVALMVLIASLHAIVLRFTAVAKPRKEPPPAPETPADLLRKMETAVARMEEGGEQESGCELIERTMRNLYGVESTGFLKLQQAAAGDKPQYMPLVLVLGFTHEVLYARKGLDTDEVGKLKELVAEAFAVSQRLSAEDRLAGDGGRKPMISRKGWILIGVVSAIMVSAVIGVWLFALWLESLVPDVAF